MAYQLKASDSAVTPKGHPLYEVSEGHVFISEPACKEILEYASMGVPYTHIAEMIGCCDTIIPNAIKRAKLNLNKKRYRSYRKYGLSSDVSRNMAIAAQSSWRTDNGYTVRLVPRRSVDAK